MKPAEPAAGRQAGGSGRFEGREHCLPLRVYYEDTDAAGIVYYANYLRFAERARTEFLRLLGVHQNEMRSRDGLVFAVRRAELDYRQPARLDDLLEIRSRLLALTGASVTAGQRILRAGEVLVSVVVQVVCLRLADGRPGRLPKELRERLAPYVTEGSGV